MQILLSPAKDMTDAPAVQAPRLSTPRFQLEAERCALQISELDTEELADLLKINPQLAALNKRRFHDFLDPEPRMAAALAYTGMAYKHLRAEEFSAQDWEWAQEHLWISSFLYGLNRPMDAIKTHRLEGKVVLPDHEGLTMFQFWRSRLTDVLIDSCLADDGTLIYLASAEMKSLFDWKRVTKQVRVITIDHAIDLGDRLKTVVVYSKMMRGATTRQLITQRIAQPEALQDFEYEGFVYRPEHSSEARWTWVQA
ncbi:MAG: YaaA family protein [Bacteroidales bacterium]|nr:YaaA family protein [Bacteroidales bacterium]